MADDGWTTLGELEEGAVFEAHPEDAAAPDILAVKSEYHYRDGTCQCVLLASGEYAHFRRRNATRVRPLDVPALLKELDELRTLAHDLLLDRDAAYGREVGRGEALAAAEKWWEDVQDVDLEVGRLFDAIRGPTPVRPLPPPERLAARCRALEDALRAIASAWDDRGGPLSPQGPIGAARKLLEEISADE
jgi:hypothetical protein